MNKVIITDTISANITVVVLDMEAGELTAFRYNDRVFRPEPTGKSLVASFDNAIKQKKRGQACVVEKYIKSNKLDMFSIAQFFKDNPDQKKFKTRITGYVSTLMADKKIIQHTNDLFFVNKKLIT